MRRQVLPALLMMVVFTVLAGVAYPLVITAAGQVAFRDKADGSLVKVGGKPVGSRLIGQTFSQPKYFQGRPSAAGAAATGSDATDPAHPDAAIPNDPKDLTQVNSSGSNAGPTNPEFIKTVRRRVEQYRKENALAADSRVPVDAVTASGSGLDPQISIANARIQARRVARERGLRLTRVLRLVGEHTDGRSLGVFGEKGVNVLELNLALDRLAAP
jgi:potassium-transporting ATPase KdpC subunit